MAGPGKILCTPSKLSNLQTQNTETLVYQSQSYSSISVNDPRVENVSLILGSLGNPPHVTISIQAISQRILIMEYYPGEDEAVLNGQ